MTPHLPSRGLQPLRARVHPNPLDRRSLDRRLLDRRLLDGRLLNRRQREGLAIDDAVEHIIVVEADVIQIGMVADDGKTEIGGARVDQGKIGVENISWHGGGLRGVAKAGQGFGFVVKGGDDRQQAHHFKNFPHAIGGVNQFQAAAHARERNVGPDDGSDAGAINHGEVGKIQQELARALSDQLSQLDIEQVGVRADCGSALELHDGDIAGQPSRNFKGHSEIISLEMDLIKLGKKLRQSEQQILVCRQAGLATSASAAAQLVTTT